MKRLVEIRSYNLKAGHRGEFHRLVLEESYPLLKKWHVDVIDFGPSPHDENSYYLIRAYRDLADRTASQEAFYGSAEWRDGPRDAILPLIDTYSTIVLEMDEATLGALRRAPR